MILVTKTSDQTRVYVFVCVCVCGCIYVCVCVCVFIDFAHNRRVRPCHSTHSMPLALTLPRRDQSCVRARARACVFID